jgi:hypothetical protein
MPNIQPLLITLRLHSSAFLLLQMGTNPNLMVFNKRYRNILQMKNLYLMFLLLTLQPENKATLNANHNPLWEHVELMTYL